MPGRLIVFITVLCLVALLVGMNIEFRSDIRIWFGDKGLLKNVHIVLSFFVMYVAGLLSALPYGLAYRARIRAKLRQNMNDGNTNEEPPKKIIFEEQKTN